MRLFLSVSVLAVATVLFSPSATGSAAPPRSRIVATNDSWWQSHQWELEQEFLDDEVQKTDTLF